MIFYVGLDDVHFSGHFDHSFISVNRLWQRRKAGLFQPKRWIMDSGAFTEISTHGEYRQEPEVYAAEIDRWAAVGELELAVSQDYMCEPFILERTGLDVQTHQRKTIERYDRIRNASSATIMPVLQGYAIEEYLNHADAYGDRLRPGMRVGVGSVCKRNTSVQQVEEILCAIRDARPGLLLHGFGVKTTALGSSLVWECLHSADSMAWSFAARKSGLDAHDWRQAKQFEQRILTQRRYRPHRQLSLL